MTPIFKNYEKLKLNMQSSFLFDGKEYLFFEEKVPFYTLFFFRYKLNSIYSIFYAGEVLLHLNPNLSIEQFIMLMLEISDRKNGVSINSYPEEVVLDWCNEYFYNRNPQPYTKTYRRIVFNKAKGLSMSERMVIINRLLKRNKVNDVMISDVIDEMTEDNSKITIKSISEKLGISRQSVYNYLNNEHIETIKEHNKRISGESYIVELISSITDGDETKIEMLKELFTEINSYQVRKFLS